MTTVIKSASAAHSFLGIPPPLLAAIVSAVVSAGVSWAVASVSLRAQRRQHIENMISKLIDLGVQYPYLEDDVFCSGWREADKTQEAVQRYDNYCCFVFNLVEAIWRFDHGHAKRIEKWFGVRELVNRHKEWWASEPYNASGYAKGFRTYVEGLISGGAR